MEAIDLISNVFRIIAQLRPTYWFIENPRGMLRKIPPFDSLPIRTISYCRYGEDRQKPTDVWTNCDIWKDRGICKRGDSCHVAAPRGSRTGTQGRKGAYNRAILPLELCEEISAVVRDG